MSSQWVDQAVPCRDPECAERGGMAEPDGDAEMRYYTCTECGYEFGYQQVKQDTGTCQIGVPEGVRRAASAGAERAMAQSQPVLLQIGRRPTDG